MASSTTGPMKLYCAVAGYNGPFDPRHVHAWRVEDEAGEMLHSNSGSVPEFSEGTLDKGFYGAIAEALRAMPLGADVRLVSPKGSETYWVFRDRIEDRQRSGYRKRDKALLANHKLIREVDQLSAELGITITAYEPATSHEVEMRFTVEDEAKQRMRDAAEASELEALQQ